MAKPNYAFQKRQKEIAKKKKKEEKLLQKAAAAESETQDDTSPSGNDDKADTTDDIKQDEPSWTFFSSSGSLKMCRLLVLFAERQRFSLWIKLIPESCWIVNEPQLIQLKKKSIF